MDHQNLCKIQPAYDTCQRTQDDIAKSINGVCACTRTKYISAKHSIVLTWKCQTHSCEAYCTRNMKHTFALPTIPGRERSVLPLVLADAIFFIDPHEEPAVLDQVPGFVVTGSREPPRLAMPPNEVGGCHRDKSATACEVKVACAACHATNIFQLKHVT